MGLLKSREAVQVARDAHQLADSVFHREYDEKLSLQFDAYFSPLRVLQRVPTSSKGHEVVNIAVVPNITVVNNSYYPTTIVNIQYANYCSWGTECDSAVCGGRWVKGDATLRTLPITINPGEFVTVVDTLLLWFSSNSLRLHELNQTYNYWPFKKPREYFDVPVHNWTDVPWHLFYPFTDKSKRDSLPCDYLRTDITTARGQHVIDTLVWYDS